jgi:hypothetical protein
MLKTALDLVPILEAIDVVKSSKLLTKAQQETVMREIASAIPAPVFCKQCPETLEILNSIVRLNDGISTKGTSPKKTTKTESNAQEGTATLEEPISFTASDARGPSEVSGDAEEPKEQGRSASKRPRRVH